MEEDSLCTLYDIPVPNSILRITIAGHIAACLGFSVKDKSVFMFYVGLY